MAPKELFAQQLLPMGSLPTYDPNSNCRTSNLNRRDWLGVTYQGDDHNALTI